MLTAVSADLELLGRVWPRRGRTGAGRHQERHAELLGLGLLVRARLRLERQHVAQQPLTHREELIRIDYDMTSKWRMTGRYMQRSEIFDLPCGISGWSTGGNLDTMNVVQKTLGLNWLVSTTGVLSNTTSLEISVGSAHNSLDHYTENKNLTRTGASMSSLPMLYTSSIQNDYIPYFTCGGGASATIPSPARASMLLSSAAWCRTPGIDSMERCRPARASIRRSLTGASSRSPLAWDSRMTSRASRRSWCAAPSGSSTTARRATRGSTWSTILRACSRRR